MRNCVVFIIWPLPAGDDTVKPYDIEAVRKLQPSAVSIVYECTGASGSPALRLFLRDDNLETVPAHEIGAQNWMSGVGHTWRKEKKKEITQGLDNNYSVTEITHQRIRHEGAGTYLHC